jgi:hypothetical protein
MSDDEKEMAAMRMSKRYAGLGATKEQNQQ